MSVRKRVRDTITKKTLEELTKHEITDPLYRGMEQIRHKLGKEEPDIIDQAIAHLRKAYQKSTEEEREELERRIYKKTSYIPNYNHAFTRSIYWLVKRIGQEAVFDKIHVTGYADEVLEQAQKGGLIILPTHNDMYDTVMYAHHFIENGLKPPVFFMGHKLRGGINTYILPMFNAMFLKTKNRTHLDTLLLAKETKQLLAEGENLIIYPEGTRSRDGKVKKRQKMKRGYIGIGLRANNRIERDLYYCVATVACPVFTDILKDYQLEQAGRKVKINTFGRILNMDIFNLVSKESGIFIYFTRPVRIRKGPSSWNTWANRNRYNTIIWNQLRNKITVTPEYLMAYTLRFMQIAEPDYTSLRPGQRQSMIRDLYFCHMDYAKSRDDIIKAPILNNHPDRSFEIGLEFFRQPELSIVTEDCIINEHPLLFYDSNKIQHFYREKYPLVTEERLGPIDRLRYRMH